MSRIRLHQFAPAFGLELHEPCAAVWQADDSVGHAPMRRAGELVGHAADASDGLDQMGFDVFLKHDA